MKSARMWRIHHIPIDSGSNIVVMTPDMDPLAREYTKLLSVIIQTGPDALEYKKIICWWSNSSLLPEDN